MRNKKHLVPEELASLSVIKEELRAYLTDDPQLLTQLATTFSSLYAFNEHEFFEEEKAKEIDRPVSQGFKPPKIIVPGSTVPVNEIINLLKDAYDGKANESLQEILNKAEVKLSMVKKNPSDLASKKSLKIEIKLAATAIDKYAGILQTIVEQKGSSKKDEKIIHQAHKTHQAINSLNNRLRRINLDYALIKIEMEAKDYIGDHTSVHCLSFLFPAEGKSKIYREIMDWVGKLTLPEQGLIEHEVIGAIYTVRGNLHLVSKMEGKAINAAINSFLTRTKYPHNDEDAQIYIEEFNHRALQIGLDLPAKMHFLNEKTPSPLSTPG